MVARPPPPVPRLPVIAAVYAELRRWTPLVCLSTAPRGQTALQCADAEMWCFQLLSLLYPLRGPRIATLAATPRNLRALLSLFGTGSSRLRRRVSEMLWSLIPWLPGGDRASGGNGCNADGLDDAAGGTQGEAGRVRQALLGALLKA